MTQPSNDYRFLLDAVSAARPAAAGVEVSVVVPFYSGRLLAERLFASLSSQTYPPELMEVVVVADGPEECGDLVDRWLPRVRRQMVRIPRQGFRIATVRNEGIRRARADTVLFLDSDIIVPPGLVESHLRWATLPVPTASIGARRFVDAGTLTPDLAARDFPRFAALPDVDSISNTNPHGLDDRRMPELERLYASAFPGNTFFSCNAAFPRALALEIGGFDETFNGSFGYDDIDFGCRLAAAGAYLAFEPAATVLHQENAVVGTAQRRAGVPRNLGLLLSRHPGLREYRAGLGQRVA